MTTVLWGGCFFDGFPDKIHALRLEEAMPWDALPTPLGGDRASPYGEEGSNYHKEYNLLGDYVPKADGSVLIENLPCDRGYRHSVVDEQGNTLAITEKLIWPGCGTRTTCHGCHDGHSEERLAELGLSDMMMPAGANQRFAQTEAYKPLPPGC